MTPEDDLIDEQFDPEEDEWDYEWESRMDDDRDLFIYDDAGYFDGRYESE